ncbi:MAG: ribosome small subunit-dependent GTPase A, partial [Eubacteriales bacterium]|nr:ribosome small subunit-dependent GTPase A [Eubacteriales bacterium]
MDGLIVKGVGGFYYVIDEGGRTHTLRAQGKLRRQRITPLVGDRVSFEAGEGEAHGWLNAVRERKNS